MANIKNRKKMKLIQTRFQTIWDVVLYSQHFAFHWKLLVLVSRIEKYGTGDNNFGKWKGTFRSHRPKWPDRSQWTTFKAGPEYSGRTKPKWSVPFDEPSGISGLLGWMESAHSIQWPLNRLYLLYCICYPSSVSDVTEAKEVGHWCWWEQVQFNHGSLSAFMRAALGVCLSHIVMQMRDDIMSRKRK